MKVQDLIKILETDGWFQIRMRGSHRQFKHSTKSGLVTVPGKSSDDVPIGLEYNIYRQAKIERR